MDFKEDKKGEPCAKMQLMKKVIVRMADNNLQLNFHPKLAAIARTERLRVGVKLEVIIGGNARHIQNFAVDFC